MGRTTAFIRRAPPPLALPASPLPGGLSAGPQSVLAAGTGPCDTVGTGYRSDATSGIATGSGSQG